MTTEVYRKPGLGAKLADVMAGARDQARTALREAMTWSFYQWTVLALLTAIFILVALSYGGIRGELGALKSERGPEAGAADLDKRLTDMNATLMQSITETKANLDKINAKLDAKSQAAPKPPAPAQAPKPAQKPRAQ
jgi:hypothetical protein